MKNITIKDIAREANVSTATVSRVINKKGTVSSTTEAKILQAIKKLGYHPNLVARSLKNSSTQTISLVVSDISNAYFAKLSLAVEKAIHPQDYNLIVCSTGDNPIKEATDIQLLLEKKVDGIILNTTGGNNELIATLSKRIPIVLCNRRIDTPTITSDFVDNDNFTATYKLTNYLIKQGHRKIGIINGPLSVSSAQERFEGFRAAMAEINVDFTEDNQYYFSAAYDENSGYQAAEKIFSLTEQPTALIIMNGPMTIGALRYFRSNNISIPNDISIASATDIINQELFYVQLCVATMDPWIIGKRSAELLLDRIQNNNNLPNREIRYNSEILLGDSVKKINL